MLITRWGFTIALLSTIAMTPLYANMDSHAPDGGDPKKLKVALEKVQEKIQALEKNIYQSKSQERDCIEQLAQMDKEIGERDETLRQLEFKMAQHDQSLTRLRFHHNQLSQQQNIQQAALAQLVQSTYQHYHRERLRLLLEPNESTSLARLNQYYQFFYEARSRKLHDLQVDLKKIQTVQLEILKEQQVAREMQLKLGSEKLALAESKESRTRLLSTLSQRLSGETYQLQSLQHQQQHLDQLFGALNKQLAITPSVAQPSQHFAKMKRQLPFPVDAPNLKLALAPNAKTQQKKSYIAAAEGTPVVAVFPGKVVFSEWLRGVGFLTILDHGNGYMSLYGNNQKLYKSIGDVVEQGEMIARVGQSGGHAEPGLYFEIRKNGEALDPTQWIKHG